MYTLTTFRSVPSFAVGHVRDLRVRWALEEAGQTYDLRLIDFEEKESPAYRREQPFAQVPVLHDGDRSLFDTRTMRQSCGMPESTPSMTPRDSFMHGTTITIRDSIACNSSGATIRLPAPADMPESSSMTRCSS